jgi:hypothetical protein
LYGSESWVVTKADENKLKVFEKNILRKIYGPINDKGEWRIRYNYELYKLFDEPDIIKVIKGRRLRWMDTYLDLRNHTPVEK